MTPRAWVAICLIMLVGCSSNSADYPPLTDPFGKAVQVAGDTQVKRGNQTFSLETGDAIFAGDRLLTGTGGVTEIDLAPGQVVQLAPGTIWQIQQVVSNGAAFGSESTLDTGSLRLFGREYMPHRLIIRTAYAEISTYSENFRISHRLSEPGLMIESFENVPITINSEHGRQVIDQANQMIVLTGKTMD